MKNKASIIFTLLVLLAPLAISATATFEITPDIDTMVPENALLYFHISSPEEFMQSMDKFLMTSGLNQLTDNMKVLDFLTAAMESGKTWLSLDYMDLSNPVGLVLLPKEIKPDEERDMDFMLFLPVNKGKNILDIAENRSEEKDYWYKTYMNYIVFFSTEKLKNDFPPGNIKELSQINSYKSDSFSLYLDMKGFVQFLYPDPSILADKLKPDDSSNPEFSSGTIEGYINLLGQIKSLFSNITLNQEGITIKNKLVFVETMENQLKNFISPGSIKKWSSLLPEKSILQGIFSLDSENQNFIMKTAADYLFTSGKNIPVMSELKRTMELFSEFRGNGGMFSLNILPSSSKSSKIPFDPDISMVSDLRDKEGYIKELRNYYTKQVFNTIFDELYPETDFSIRLTMEEQNIEGMNPVFRVKYQLHDRKKKSGTNNNGTDQSAEFPEGMEIWYYFTSDRVYSYIGFRGIEGLKKLIDSKNPEKDWIASAPEDSSLIWNFSPGGLMKVLGTIPGIEEFIPSNNITFDISGFSGFEKGILKTSTQVPADNILNLIRIFGMPE